MVRHVDWSIVKCLVIAGPGFAKDSFKTYLDAEAVKRDIRPLIENKASVFTAPVSQPASLTAVWSTHSTLQCVAVWGSAVMHLVKIHMLIPR